MLNFGKEQTVSALGKKWKVARLELHIIEAFRDWVAEQEGDVFAIAEKFIDRLPKESAMELVRDAEALDKQLKGFSLNCPLAQRHMATERGAAQLLYQLLLPNHPDVTPDLAFSIIAEVGQEEVRKKMTAASGEDPRGNAETPAAQPAMAS